MPFPYKYVDDIPALYRYLKDTPNRKEKLEIVYIYIYI